MMTAHRPENKNDLQSQAGTAPRTKSSTILVKIVKCALLAVVLFFVGRALLNRMGNLSWEDVRLDPILVALAIACILTGKLLAVGAYRTLLKSFSKPPGWPAMAAITWVPPLGKYLPGKVASIAGAVWLLGKQGLSVPMATSIVLMLSGLSLLVGAIIAMTLALGRFAYLVPTVVRVGCAMLVIIGLICLHPKVFGPVANFFLRLLRRQPLKELPRLRDLVLPLILTAGNWILSGIALLLTARSLTGVSLDLAPLFVAAQALALIAGFLAFFAPGGIGVREGILLGILAPVIGGGPAGIVALTIRLFQTATDIFVAGIGLIILRWLRKSSP